MNEEIKSALLRVLPYLIVILILLVATKKEKIKAFEIGLTKPKSLMSFFIWIC